jgi:hypothetical protein
LIAQETQVRLVAKVKRLQAAGNSFGWELADAYAELQEAGYTVRRIAEECGSDKSNVGRLIRMSQIWDIPTERPAFLQASQTIIRRSREVEAQQRARARAAEVEGLGLVDEVRLGDFRKVLADVPDGSADLIFTDPPFARESLPLFADLGRFAARVLCDGGSLITYFGQYSFVEVGSALKAAGLTPRWLLCVPHQYGMARVHSPKISVQMKPIMWFSGGGKAPYQTAFVNDLIPSTHPDKKAHDWQQSETEASYLIEQLSPPGGLVVDPMAGSGTTLVAAARLGRRCLGAEIVETHCRQASKRIASAKSGKP